MKKINVLYHDEGIVYYTIFPIINSIHIFRDYGYNVNFFKKVCSRILDCDILLLISKSAFRHFNESSGYYKTNGELIKFLKKNKNVMKKIWFDNSDSTSTTNFELMPYVDVYLKKQILKDRSLYKKEFYGGRIFTEYYNKKFKISDDQTIEKSFRLQNNYNKKLKLGWNIGLGNVHISFSYIHEIIRKLFPTSNFFKYPKNFVSINSQKDIDFFFRGSVNYNLNTIKFHRQRFVENLNSILSKKKSTSIINKEIYGKNSSLNFIKKAKGFLSDKDYKKIQDCSKVSFSPFGWGELGARDYESIISGSLLVKPSLNHMETWPDIFLPHETYLPFDWDFKNLEETINKSLQPSIRKRISSNSQEAYKGSINVHGMNKFVKRFLTQIEEK